MRQPLLTTIDNPYNPFNEFDKWFLFDIEKGYNTSSYLARMTKIESDMSDDEVTIMLEQAIDKIIKNDFLGIYLKVYKNDAIPAAIES